MLRMTAQQGTHLGIAPSTASARSSTDRFTRVFTSSQVSAVALSIRLRLCSAALRDWRIRATARSLTGSTLRLHLGRQLLDLGVQLSQLLPDGGRKSLPLIEREIAGLDRRLGDVGSTHT